MHAVILGLQAPSAASAATTRAGTCTGPVLGVQPPLQLSLDHILFENYGQNLVGHAGMMPAFNHGFCPTDSVAVPKL